MLPLSLTQLIKKIRILPGVGPKTAQRYALYLIERHPSQARELAASLAHALEVLIHCESCGMLKEQTQACTLCSNPERDEHTLMIVPGIFDVLHFEQLHCYKGLYHVLGGQLSPLDGIGPQQLHLANLLTRIQTQQVKEVILALSPTLEGEATAYYIANLLKDTSTQVSRLATGIPVGGDLEHIDAHTLSLSIKGRHPYHHHHS